MANEHDDPRIPFAWRLDKIEELAASKEDDTDKIGWQAHLVRLVEIECIASRGWGYWWVYHVQLYQLPTGQVVFQTNLNWSEDCLMKLDSKKETTAFFDRLPIVTVCYIPFSLGGGDILFQRETGDCYAKTLQAGAKHVLGIIARRRWFNAGKRHWEAVVDGRDHNEDSVVMMRHRYM
jgi:hypothetical protein